MFGVALKEQLVENVDSLRVKALKRGYIIHPECCTESVADWLDNTTVNLNSTFYKNWEEVMSKTRLELLWDQLDHYVCGYVDNDMDYSLVPDIRKYKVIKPISRKDLYNKCEDMLISGIALKKQTVTVLCKYMCDYINDVTAVAKYHVISLINRIKNKEAITIFCDEYGVYPTDKFDLLRYIVYKVTGESQIIKDKNIITRMRYGKSFDMSKLEPTALRDLSSIFYRFKPVFMGLKHNDPKNKTIINKIRRMAKLNHSAFYPGFWESLVHIPFSEEYVISRIINDKPTNFKLIQLIQCCTENILNYMSEDKYHMYTIRNGSVYFKKSTHEKDMREWWDSLRSILYNELTIRLGSKFNTFSQKVYVKLPSNINLTCPSSEKTFVGNIPYGSNCELAKNNIVSIYWRNEWGTHDFDLSYTDFKGNRISWCSDYSKNDVVYSGDMTYADPEAAESIMFKNNVNDGIFYINRFNGAPNSKYIFTISQNDMDVLPKNYMVDPNTIKFQANMVSSDKRGSMLGYVCNKQLYFCSLDVSNNRVNVIDPDVYKDVLHRKAVSFLDLEMVLMDSGFNIYAENIQTEEDASIIDLSELNKDTIIDFLTY